MRWSGSNAVDSGLKAFQAIIDFPTNFHRQIFKLLKFSIDVTKNVNKGTFVISSVRGAFVGAFARLNWLSISGNVTIVCNGRFGEELFSLCFLYFTPNPTKRFKGKSKRA